MTAASEAAARFDRKISRKTSNLGDVRLRAAGLSGKIDALKFLQKNRWSSSRALAIVALERSLANAMARKRRMDKSLSDSIDAHRRQQDIIAARRRAKISIGSVRSTNASFLPGTKQGQMVSTIFTSVSKFNGTSVSDLGQSPVETVTLAHVSAYQNVKALRARHIPLPWLPYSRTVETSRNAVGFMVNQLSSTDVDSATGPLVPVGFPIGGLPSWIASFPSQDEVSGSSSTELLSKSLSVIHENDFDVLTQLVEFNETRELGSQLLRQAQTWMATHADLAGEIGKLKGGARILPFVAASAWLSTQLAFRPLIMAAKDIGAFERFPGNLQVTVSGANRPRVKRSWEGSSSLGSSTWQGQVLLRADYRQRFGFTFDITNPAIFAENQLHLREPLSAIWEGATLSFVVDYFVKLGEFIRAVEQRAAVSQSGKLQDAWLINTYDRKITIVPRGTASFTFGLFHPILWESKSYSRQKTASLPRVSGIRVTSPSTATDNGRSQWLTIAALLGSLGLSPVEKALKTTPKLPRFSSRQDFLEHWISSPVSYTSLSPLAQRDLRRNLARREAALIRS